MTAARPRRRSSLRVVAESLEVAERWELRLYVAGQTAKSRAAFANLRRLCEAQLSGQYTIEVIDLLVHPELARADQIVAVPTVVRRAPPLARRFVGDLSDPQQTLFGMERTGEH